MNESGRPQKETQQVSQQRRIPIPPRYRARATVYFTRRELEAICVAAYCGADLCDCDGKEVDAFKDRIQKVVDKARFRESWGFPDDTNKLLAFKIRNMSELDLLESSMYRINPAAALPIDVGAAVNGCVRELKASPAFTAVRNRRSRKLERFRP